MPLGRLAVTLLSVLCVLGLGRVPLPGLPPDLGTPEAAVLTTTSAAALGIMPFVTASVLVELATLIVPAWRKKRAAAAAEPSGSEPFERRRRRTALRIGVAVAAFEAWGIAKVAAIEFSDPLGPEGSPSFLLIVSLVAGSAVLLAIAMIVERYGIGSGLATVLAASLPLDRLLSPTVKDRLSLAIGIALTAALAAWALSWQKAPSDEQDKRVLSPAIPEPVGGLMGAGLAAGFIGFFATFTERPIDQWLAGFPGVDRWPVLQSIAGTTLAAFCGVAAAYLLFGPGRIAALWGRVEPRASADEIHQAVAGEVREGAVRSGLLAAAVFAIVWNLDLEASSGLWLGAALVEIYRDRRRSETLVCIDEDVRPWAAVAKETGLRREDVDVVTRGSAVERLVPLIGPIAPTLLYTTVDQEKRARKILRRIVGPEKKAAADVVPVRVERSRSPSVAVNVALAVAALGGAAWAHVDGLVQKSEDQAEGPVTPIRFELRYVEDDEELVRGDKREFELAADARGERAFVQIENVPVGGGQVRAQGYVVIEPLPNEPIEKMRERVAASLAPNVPSGKKLGWGRMTKFDRETDNFVATGLRTYVLGDVVLTERDVLDAAAHENEDLGDPDGVDVSINFTKDGGDRFEQATARYVGRRIALLVDDEVMSAPVVQGVISGGS
ncbi:MAG: hypothetical protein HOV80_33040, partial [Polyangiaceae bacterium]|nr:hypothetical protein [Polyangiaceae bacterium]